MSGADLVKKAQESAPEAKSLQELPGFRFQPTDEELVSFYLRKRLFPRPGDSGLPLLALLIPEIDIYKYDPWDLPSLASLGEGSNGCYFFSPRGKKYQNSSRPNRVTVSGFWKATGTDKSIYSDSSHLKCIGLKKSLVFYQGRASKSTKSNWIMHEFRLPAQHGCSADDACWALCKIFKRKSASSPKTSVWSTAPIASIDISGSLKNSKADELDDSTYPTSICNASFPSSSDMPTSSNFDSKVREDTLAPSEPTTRGSSPLVRTPPLAVRVSKSNSWFNDAPSPWSSPSAMKFTGQPCLAAKDWNAIDNEGSFAFECLSSLLSPHSNATLRLWD